MTHEEREALFAESLRVSGEWRTRHTIEGRDYGGALSYVGEPRFAEFLEMCRPEGRLLEVGCFEGGHTVQLAGVPGVRHVHAIDGRRYLVERTWVAVQAHGLRNVKVQIRDINDIERLRELGQYDLIFCTGVVYHLRRPWEFLKAATTLAPRMFLSTHYTTTTKTVEHGYAGRLFKEYGYADALSGLEDLSFWPGFIDLIRMLADCGWTVEKLHNYPAWKAPTHENRYALVNMSLQRA